MDLQSVEEEEVKSVLGVDRGVTPYFSLFCSPHHHQNHNICDSLGINLLIQFEFILHEFKVQ